MSSLMSYLTAFGLASGAGGKACIPVLLLGAFHYTEYFELSERFAWIANPAVMIVLGVLVIAEIIVDSSPELGEYADLVGYLPKAAAGFIAFAAATGTVDQSLVELGASGLLGSGTATAAHWLRNRVRRPIREYAEDVHEGVGRAASVGEAGVSAVVAGGAVISPIVALVFLAVLVVVALMVVRMLDRRRVPCVHCEQPIRPGAIVCIHCGREQKELAAAAEGAAGTG
jgi:hypothetical protein